MEQLGSDRLFHPEVPKVNGVKQSIAGNPCSVMIGMIVMLYIWVTNDDQINMTQHL